MQLTNQRIVVIGGSSGIGLAVAQMAAKLDNEVIIASRSLDKLKKAQAQIGNNCRIEQLDTQNEENVKAFFQRIGEFDHLQLPGSEIKFGNMDSLSIDDAKASFESKFWGVYTAVKHAKSHVSPQGSITLYSGAASQKPRKETTALSALNSAVEGLGRALAISLSPIRVNVISPGLTKTPIFDGLTKQQLDSIFQEFSDSLLIKRFAEPEEIAEAAIYLMANQYTTGTIQSVDGGLCVT